MRAIFSILLLSTLLTGCAGDKGTLPASSTPAPSGGVDVREDTKTAGDYRILGAV